MGLICCLADGTILSWTQEPWREEGEFTNPLFHIIDMTIPAGEKPTDVISLGTVGSKTYSTNKGNVTCDRVYQAATFDTIVLDTDGEGS